MTTNTDWFAACGWGVFCHYLGAFPSTDGGVELSAADWNAQVDAFDVEGLARQLASVQAPYFSAITSRWAFNGTRHHASRWPQG